MNLAQPLPDRAGWGWTPYSDPDATIRATVQWPVTMTATWTAAWRNPEAFQRAYEAARNDGVGPYYA